MPACMSGHLEQRDARGEPRCSRRACAACPCGAAPAGVRAQHSRRRAPGLGVMNVSLDSRKQG